MQRAWSVSHLRVSWQGLCVRQKNQLDAGLVHFLDDSSRKDLSVEHLISGFHSTVHKLPSLHLYDRGKGHFLLRRANLTYHDKNVVIGTATGSYEVSRSSASLRIIYWNGPPSGSTDNERNRHGKKQEIVSNRLRGKNCAGKRRGAKPQSNGYEQKKDIWATFYVPKPLDHEQLGSTLRPTFISYHRNKRFVPLHGNLS